MKPNPLSETPTDRYPYRFGRSGEGTPGQLPLPWWVSAAPLGPPHARSPCSPPPGRPDAYIIGTRATQKCLLQALLEPLAKLREYEDAGQHFERLALIEEAKSLPFGAVFDYFNLKNNVPVGESFIPVIQEYEKNVTSKR